MRELETQEVAAVAGGVDFEIVQAETGFWESLFGDVAGWLAGASNRPTSLPVVGGAGIRG